MEPDLAPLEPFLTFARTRLAAPVTDAGLEQLAITLAAVDVAALEAAARARLARVRPDAGWVGQDLLVTEHGRVGLFLLPPGEGIPLHDHPGMTVLQRVVTGRMAVVEHDWLDAASGRAGPARARVVGLEDGVTWAYPDRGNVHALVPIEPTVFLDLLAPDYDPPRRPCTYWRVEAVAEDGASVTLRATR